MYKLLSSVTLTNILTFALWFPGSAAVPAGGHPGCGVCSEKGQQWQR